MVCLLFSIILFLMVPMLGAGQVSLIENGGFQVEDGTFEPWRARGGGLGTITVKDGVLTARVSKLSERPWIMELHQMVVPEVPLGALAVVSFEYNVSPGYSFNFYWQVESPPWPKLLSMHLDKSGGWQSVKMAVPIHDKLEGKSTALSFHLGGRVGTLELRNMSMILLPPGTSPDSVDTNVLPVLGGDFYDNDWRNKARSRLRDLRSVNYTLQWKPDSEVRIRQVKRPFSFGVECPASLVTGINVAKGLDAAMLPAYRKAVFDRALFDSVTFSDGLVWRDYAAWGNKAAAKAVNEAHAAGLSVRGHALLIPAYMFAPVNCRRMKMPELDEALRKHVAEKAAIKGIDEWNVLHGVMDYQEIYNLLGVEILTDCFSTAEKHAPGARLYISDVNALCALSDVSLRDTVEFAKWLKQEGKKLDGIVLGVTVNRPDVAPQSMEKRLDYVHKELGLPIYIAGFAVNADSEARQEAMLMDYLTLFFSHPAVHGVSFGELWASARLNPRMGLFGADMKEKPAGAAVRRMLTKEWRTDMTVRTDSSGKVSFRAFLGDYEFVLGNETRKVTIAK